MAMLESMDPVESVDPVDVATCSELDLGAGYTKQRSCEVPILSFLSEACLPYPVSNLSDVFLASCLWSF